ncbi:A disintegrin and metalloproteinase with thrombospondin motifs 9-like [Ruditapes philippinarum]|uniref:A disintegrin and metalloproteinase with thrombospondin motifs 9-like n=1 Tax=Ruditapes philippinarum TaxID=129788 RepID=UPI00295BF7F3|nr:A disintegrin and metalloproteinase with thrombospondin motifs 9-like [Ruditapes philippinarum]
MALQRLIALTSIVSWIIFLTVFPFGTTNARARLSFGKSGVDEVIPVDVTSSTQDRPMNFAKKFMKLLVDISFSKGESGDTDGIRFALTTFDDQADVVFNLNDKAELKKGIGNIQTVGSCSSRPCKANQRCHQKGASHVCKFPWTCKDVKLCSPSYTDGEYWLYPEVLGGHMVKIYCAGMSTEEPLEYISVNEKENYGFNAGNLGSKKGFTRYQKIRVDLMEGKIIRNDTIFSTTCTKDISDLPPLPYGRGGGCSCEYCAKGNFSISLQGTGLKISKEVEWVTTGYRPKMRNVQRNMDNNVISAKCGGYCARCDPKGELYIAYNQNDVVADESATSPKCDSDLV